MVLLLVLVVIALLSALLSEFAFSTLVDVRLTETFRDSTRAEYLARGGIKAGQMILQQDTNDYDAYDASELWSVGIQNYPLADGEISVKIVDLDGRLNLNQLVDAVGNPNSLYRDRFIRLADELSLGDSEGLVNALIDWIDPDNETNPGGAEDDFYLTRQPAYEALDAPLQSLDELALIRGFTTEIVTRLRPFVSCYGSSQLNVNTAAPELLRSWDAESALAIDNLVSSRAEKPFRQLTELKETLGIEDYTALNRHLDLRVTSTYYLINSQAKVNDGSRRMQAVIHKNRNMLVWQKVN